MSNDFQWPSLGVGLGYRRGFRKDISEHLDSLDLMEIVVEQFFGPRIAELRNIIGRLPLVPHGVGLSVGSTCRSDPEYLQQVRRVIRAVDAPYFSEHLSVSRAPGIDVGHLTPLRHTESLLRTVSGNIDYYQSVLGVPLVFENTTDSFVVDGDGMDAADFIGELTARTGCGILLDVTNCMITEENGGIRGMDYLARIPVNRIAYAHIAGGERVGDRVVDSHSAPVPEGVWKMLAAVIDKVRLPAIILERDKKLPALGELIAEVERARGLLGLAAAD
jgi:uncharacterized protein